jgi:hypothetical protein
MRAASKRALEHVTAITPVSPFDTRDCLHRVFDTLDDEAGDTVRDDLGH